MKYLLDMNFISLPEEAALEVHSCFIYLSPFVLVEMMFGSLNSIVYAMPWKCPTFDRPEHKKAE